MPEDKPDTSSDEGILEQARKRFLTASNAEEKRRQRQLFDYKFSIGKISETESYQWNDVDRGYRIGLPVLTNNRIGPHVRQTLNQIRQGRQSPKVLPVDSGADPEKADVRMGVFRSIESKSKANVGYMTATDHQIRMGEGFVRVMPEYVGDGPTQQLVIKGIRNRFSVYADPAGVELDGSDCRWWFITEDVDNDEYESRYKELGPQAVGLTNFSGYGDEVKSWFPKGHTRIAEYFRIESTWRQEPMTNREGKSESRRLETKTAHWVLMNGIEILDRRVLPIPWLPIVRCVGEVVDVEGEVDYRGCVTDAIDAQKMLNYTESQTAVALGIAPKAPFVGYGASVAGRKEWNDANVKNYSILTANTIDPDNKVLGLLPLPQRAQTSPDIGALVLTGQRAENNLRAALGVNDVDSSERGKEQSGKAINARRAQNDLTNSHFAEHHALMVQQVGRILDAWVPYIYDAPRVMQIMGADDQQQTVMVHAGPGMAPPPGSVPPDVKVYDLKVGTYDIEISVGPSYQTQRQESVEMITQIVTADPSLLKFIGHIYFGNMDWAGAKQIAEIFKKMLPPELKDKEEGQPEIPPEVQQQMQALNQQNQLMAKELEEKTRLLEQDQAKAQADVAIQQGKAATDLEAKQAAIVSNEKIKQAELDSEEAIAAAKLKQEFSLAIMKMELEEKLAVYKAQQAERQSQHQAVEGERQRTHEADRAGVQLQSAAAEADASREHEASLAAQSAE